MITTMKANYIENNLKENRKKNCKYPFFQTATFRV